MPAFDPAAPFALLWDDSGAVARLFTSPKQVIEGADTRAAFAALRAAAQAGDWLAGALSYEAGHQLEPRLSGLEKAAPFHWFGAFGAPRLFSAAELAGLLDPWRTPVWLGQPEPLTPRDDWMAAVSRAQQWIADGDIYQANLSFPARLPFRGHPLALFARLFTPAAAPHGGLVHDGQGRWWLSLSPELFFRLDDGALLGRPMKGTARRLPEPEADQAAAAALAADPKNRAENLMITDLIRNDLGRVAETGSVQVPVLHRVESYPSVHQMTSSVSARLRDGLDALDVLAALYPCGSITGAPKIRAMEVIAKLEPAPRGIYCGSIGWIAPGARHAHFNVAIRTLEIEAGEARLGLGAGIVADSVPADEWEECQTKARFLSPAAPRTLIETMRLEAGGGIPRRRFHLARLAASARRFGFRLELAALEARLDALRPAQARRLRLLLAPGGEIALQLSAQPPAPAGPVAVAIAPLPVDPGDWRLFHKSGDRAFYDEARRASGQFECVFVTADGLLTEGSFTSLFVERDGQLLTPPARLGLLPGTLRAELLESGLAREVELTRNDLETGFLVGNSLRGLLPARLA
jgi:para-aminobenzoate synthetase/4-amino-4-deoxychorismate lyase